jgi:hypothetical protein
MCGLRTHIAAILLGLALLAPARPLAAADLAPDLHLFATCAGRLSALMEHQWLLSDPLSDQTATERAAMLSLVEAMTPPGGEAGALNWRVEAKAAQAALLAASRRPQNDPTAGTASRRSEELIGACRSLLLG